MLRQHISEAKKTLLSESSGTSSGMGSKRRMPPEASPVVNAKPQKRSFSSAMITGLLGNKMDDPAFEREALDVMLARRLLMRVGLLWGATLPISLLAPPMTALINTALISLGAWRLAEVVGFWRYRADLEGVPLAITPFETLLEKLALCLKQASQRTACLKTFDAKRFDGVRHGRGALLALGETFFHFQHLGALQMAQLYAQALDAAGQDGQGGEEMGIAVTLHDLGGVRVHGQAQTGQGLFLQFGRKEGVGAHGAGDLAHAHALDTGLDALQMALELGVEAGHLEAEAGGFGMDAVGAAHAEHALVLAGQGFQRSQHLFDVFHDELAGLHEQIAVGGVHDVGRRTAQMDVAGVGAHLFFQRSEDQPW